MLFGLISFIFSIGGLAVIIIIAIVLTKAMRHP
jgi:hypothetical protein